MKILTEKPFEYLKRKGDNKPFEELSKLLKKKRIV